MDLSEAEERASIARQLRDRIQFLEGALDDALAVINSRVFKRNDVDEHVKALRSRVAEQELELVAKERELLRAREHIEELKENLAIARRKANEERPVIQRPSSNYGCNTVRVSGY